MNIEEIARIVNDEYPGKENRIIRVLADSETAMLDLLRIATERNSRQQVVMNKLNFTLSEAEFFIDKKCKPTPEEKGITRELILNRIKKLYEDFSTIIQRI